ncbi:MAG: OsmC-related (seleno)protein [Gammaproteobacteria bacterium]
MNQLVYKIDHNVAVEKISLAPFKKGTKNEPTRFEIYLHAERKDGMISRAEVGTNSPTWGSFSIISDEGKAIGGTDTAPAPLDYFTAGVGFCFLSHIAMYSRAVKLKIDKADLELRMKFSVINNPDKIEENGLQGKNEGLEFHLMVKSEEPEEKIRTMFDECIRACLAIQSLTNPVPLNSHLHLNGIELT